MLVPPSYLALPAKFYREARPEVPPYPRMVVFNEDLARQLGFELRDDRILSGAELSPGTIPLALGYAGHQFGHYTTLGDGRAILLGEFIGADGKRWDVQLKGSGRTPFSRRGDGKALLGPMLREYIISEAMAALGIPTTRSLAVLTTGESVLRSGMEPGAILVRIAASHLRIGSFEYASDDDVGVLADFTIERHFPEFKTASNRYVRLLEEVISRQARLIAQWMAVGFIHGVMNTDNVALSGETIDYGPCAFMNEYNPATVYSSIDQRGRYAYGNQPAIMEWNLARFAETLLPLLAASKESAIGIAEECLREFPTLYNQAYEKVMTRKLGGAFGALEPLLDWMYRSRADYTNTFAGLTRESASISDREFLDWHAQWRSAATTAPVNHKVVPRNQIVEEALRAAVSGGDTTPLHDLVATMQRPDQWPEDRYMGSRDPAEYRTFCGT